MAMTRFSSENLHPEILTETLITRFIHVSNRVWDYLYYDRVVDLPDCQITLSRLKDIYLNSAHAVRTNNLRAIEEFFQKQGVTPAVYTDPYTPTSLIAALQAGGYHLQDSATDKNETEIWKVIDLSSVSPELSSAFEPKDHELSLVFVKLSEGDKDLEDFLKIDQVTNDLDVTTVDFMRRNLLTKSVPGVQIFPAVARIKDQPVGVSCLGVSDGIAHLSEGGTLAEFRGQGIAPWRIHMMIKKALSLGCKFLVTNILETNHSSRRSSDKAGLIDGFYRHLWVKN